MTPGIETRSRLIRHLDRRARSGWLLRQLVIAVSIVLMSLPCSARSHLEVEHCDWGFDDRAVPRKFNLLTIGIANMSSKPFEGMIELRRLQNAAGAWVGAPHRQPVYLAPYAKRVVQFYPYVLDDSEEWEVRWGEELEDSYVTELAALTPGARVILNHPVQSSGIVAGLKGFRDDFFPTSVIGTDGLLMLAIDHSPKWEEVRKQAFRDWLFRGGVLHVMHGFDRQFPQLPIAELNDGLRRESYGAGRIYWHDFDRSFLTREYIFREFFPTAKPMVDVTDFTGFSFGIDPTSSEFIKKENVNRYFRSYAEWNSDELIPMQLRYLIRTAQNWPLIYLMSGVYLLLIFPGGPLLARAGIDYRLSLTALVGVVCVFSVLFAFAGARGFDESTVTHSLSIARPLPNGRWDVEQWGSVFVTAGGDYTMTHSGEQSAYSTAQNLEMLESALIESGTRPRMTFDIPPFTYRTFVRRGVTSLPGFDFSIGTCTRSVTTLKVLQLKHTGTLPEKIESARLMYAGQFYSVDINRLRAAENCVDTMRPASDFLGLDSSFHRLQSDVSEGTQSIYRKLDQWMIARQVGLRLRKDAQSVSLPIDRARLFLYARTPVELATRDGEDPTKSLGSQEGRVLYAIDLMLPQHGLVDESALLNPNPDQPNGDRPLTPGQILNKQPVNE